MKLVLIAVHMQNIHNNTIIGFRLLDTDNGEVRDIKSENVLDVIAHTDVQISGLTIQDGKPKGSNGSLDRYTKIINNVAIDRCPLVIITEHPDEYYTVANHLGQMTKMSTFDIIRFSDGIANGKIINGNRISSISGEYDKSKEFQDIAYGDKLKAKMKILGASQYKLDENNLAIACDKDVEEVTLGRGCLGIAKNGFRECRKLKSITLSNTCTTIGACAFYECTELEEIKLVEGIKKLSNLTFYHTGIKRLDIPNSISLIEDRAFNGMNNLKLITIGQNRPRFDGILPNHAKFQRR